MSSIDPLRPDAHADDLYSLVYTSAATVPFTPDDLEHLLRNSRTRNHDDGITGLLLYRRGRFVQFLEGPESAVQALLARIRADPRHENIRVLIDGFTPSRQLPEWTMGYETVADARTPAPPGFRDTFDDLEILDDRDAVIRAMRELTLWFRVRSG